MKISDSFRSHFIREVLIPLIVVLMVTFSAAAFTLYWATVSTNQDESLQQQEIIKTTLTQSLTDVLSQQRSLTGWQPLADQLARAEPDVRWLDENIGAWLSTMFDHRLIYLLDEAGAPRYLWENGVSVPASRFDHVVKPIEHVRQSLQTRASDVGPGRDRVDYVLVDNRPAMLALGEIAGEGGDGRFTMASIRFIDDGWLKNLAQRSLLQNLRFSPSPAEADTDAGYQLRTIDGLTIGHLLWQADRPGSRMLSVMGPLVIAVVLVITLICVFMIRRLWVSSLRLSNSLLQLGASEAQAQHLAFHDVLTGLPNRALVAERLTQALHPLSRGESKVALLMLDLDRFKIVNDTFGHHAGDELIAEVGQRLSALVRESDTVGRLGGDEFIIIQTEVQTTADVQALCQRIVDSLSAPFILLGSEAWIGVSIGVALAPDDASERLEMMRKADIALYEAKNKGRGQYRLFEAGMDESMKTRQQIGTDLRLALQSRQGLAVYYQPLMDIEGQKVVGLEALMRWQHPQRGAISPTEFIPIAEEMGLIMQLGEWVLREACRVARQWPDLTVAVNVSPLQFRTAGFVERFTAIVRKEQVPPARIELEITEGVLIDDEDAAHGIINALRAAGFRIALDDFGTGYSSLNYLSHFPVDKIKIDRSFTQSLGITENSSAIIESVVKLGHAMGLTVTAEGVETDVQMNALAEAGCNQLQGYLFSQAVPQHEIAQLLEQRRAG